MEIVHAHDGQRHGPGRLVGRGVLLPCGATAITMFCCCGVPVYGFVSSGNVVFVFVFVLVLFVVVATMRHIFFAFYCCTICGDDLYTKEYVF